MTFQFNPYTLNNPVGDLGEASDSFTIEIYKYNFTTHTSAIDATRTQTGVTLSTVSAINGATLVTGYEISGFTGVDMSIDFTSHSNLCDNIHVYTSNTNILTTDFGAKGLLLSNTGNALTVYNPNSDGSTLTNYTTSGSTYTVPYLGSDPSKITTTGTTTIATLVTIPTFSVAGGAYAQAPLSGFTLTHVQTTTLAGGSAGTPLSNGILNITSTGFTITSDAGSNPYFEHYTLTCKGVGYSKSLLTPGVYHGQYLLHYVSSPYTALIDFYFTITA